MALIICPECGKEVSSSAVACPACGYPISANNPCGTVSIKIASGLAGKVKVLNMENGKILWAGKAGQVARIEVNGTTHIGLTWGISSKPAPEHQAYVSARERYELTWRQGFLTNSIVLNHVDTIDSD